MVRSCAHALADPTESLWAATKDQNFGSLPARMLSLEARSVANRSKSVHNRAALRAEA
jgi:hypothetical protein